jgi:hypothetical protein
MLEEECEGGLRSGEGGRPFLDNRKMCLRELRLACVFQFRFLELVQSFLFDLKEQD